MVGHCRSMHAVFQADLDAMGIEGSEGPVDETSAVSGTTIRVMGPCGLRLERWSSSYESLDLRGWTQDALVLKEPRNCRAAQILGCGMRCRSFG